MMKDSFDRFQPPSRGLFGGDHGRSSEGARKSDLVDITMVKFAETEKAVLVGETDKRELAVWLPKSQIETESEGGLSVTVTMPEWLAMQHGLI